MLFNSVFANNAILSCLFFFYLTIDLYFLIPLSISELVISIGILSKGEKAEIEVHTVTAEAKIRKCSM